MELIHSLVYSIYRKLKNIKIDIFLKNKNN